MKHVILPMFAMYMILQNNTVTTLSGEAIEPDADGNYLLTLSVDTKKQKAGEIAKVSPKTLESLTSAENIVWLEQKAAPAPAPAATPKAPSVRQELKKKIAAATTAVLNAKGEAVMPAVLELQKLQAQLEALGTEKPAAKEMSAEEIASNERIQALRVAFTEAEKALDEAIIAHNATAGFGKQKRSGRAEGTSGSRGAGKQLTYDEAQEIRKYIAENPELKKHEICTHFGLEPVAFDRIKYYRQYRLVKGDTMHLPFSDKFFNCFAGEKINEIPGIMEVAAKAKGATEALKLQAAWYSVKPTETAPDDSTVDEGTEAPAEGTEATA
jgi:hypothetical protein